MNKPSNPDLQALSARWVLPITAPPLRDAVVVIEGDAICNVLERRQFTQRFPDKAFIDYGNAIILPGLINLHTHLDYSALRHFDSQSGLLEWIRGLVGKASSWSAGQWRSSALAGAKRIALSGTSCVADSSYNGTAAWALAQLGLRGVVGLELFGLNTDRADNTWQDWLAKHNAFSSSDNGSLRKALHSALVKLTVAPHAPYTVCPALWRHAVNWAQENNLPLLTHLSESEEECHWIASSKAKVDELLLAMNPENKSCLASTFAWRGKGHSPVSHLAHHGLLDSQTIAAHTVHLAKSDIALLADNHVKVAHCPRSNARLRNGIAPIAQLLEADIELGFGTDSLASTDDLDVLAEARFGWNLRRAVEPGFCLPAHEAIYRLTAGAAKILNLSDKIGSLATGKQADIAVFEISEPATYGMEYPFDLLLYGECTLQDLFVQGKKIVQNSTLLGWEV